MLYSIENSCLKVAVDTVGAEIKSVLFHGEERLAITASAGDKVISYAPILFPVCGRCSMIVDGVAYPIAMHGVLRRKEFVLEEKGEDFLRFSLTADEETKAMYPFDFVFTATYRLEENVITAEFDIQNVGEKTMYFSIGAHESYALPNGLDGYYLQFEKEEHFLHHKYVGGYQTDETVDLGTGNILQFPKNILTGGDTLILPNIRSQRVILKRQDGKVMSTVTLGGLKNLLLWRVGEENMICIEPWLTLPDDKVRYQTEHCQKPGLAVLKGGESTSIIRKISYE